MNERTDFQDAAWVIMWEYRVKESHRQEFETIYGPNGDWAKLFGRAEGYLGTRLLRDTEDDAKYITVDCWQSEKAFDAFRNQFVSEYTDLDRRCERLTESERHLGTTKRTST